VTTAPQPATPHLLPPAARSGARLGARSEHGLGGSGPREARAWGAPLGTLSPSFQDSRERDAALLAVLANPRARCAGTDPQWSNVQGVGPRGPYDFSNVTCLTPEIQAHDGRIKPTVR